MKKLIIVSGLLLSIFSALNAQNCKLVRVGDKYIGDCNISLFTGFEVAINSDSKIKSVKDLLRNMPTTGTTTLRGKAKTSVNYVITKRAGYRQILFKPTSLPRLGWFTFDNIEVRNDSLFFDIDTDPNVPYGRKDLKIIKQVRKLFPNEESWNRQDDRACEEDIETGIYSFFCALQYASVQVEGAYNHRNATMQLMRHLIQNRFPGRQWEHRFRDFNNMPETSFQDIMDIIDEAEQIIKKEIKKG